ncbi:MAG: pantoate--beta-alanine ligase [Proteobacteria bacterium]|nr:pantoate--beta-alanine ligase [Pseudomonadota bacterium]
MRGVCLKARKKGERVVLVPTMGGLHRGHTELIKRARALGELLIVSVFVNPTQFGSNEDLSTYPSDLTGDTEKAREAGADIIFHPAASALYPNGFQSFVEVGGTSGLSSNLCGLTRPGHFKGVATIVTKLFNIITPDTALFGLKDFQQYTIIKRLVRELDMGIDIVGVETVRDPDGLALSSRNAYLTPSEREAAGVVPASIKAASELFDKGVRKSAEIIEEIKKNIEKEPQAVIDYVLVCDPETLEDIEDIDGGALVAVAIKIGKARLIDNVLLGKGAAGLSKL